MAQLFEWDDDKNRKNELKHGISFERALELWTDKNLVTLKSKVEVDELRILNIGIMDGIHFTAITTKRKESIRIISVRRSRKNEVTFYEKKNLSE